MKQNDQDSFIVWQQRRVKVRALSQHSRSAKISEGYINY